MTAGEEFVVVRTFWTIPEAQLAQSALDAAGIETRLWDEHAISMNWLYTNMLGGVKLAVPPERVSEALSLLDSAAVLPGGVTSDADTGRFQDAVAGLKRGDFSDLEHLFVATGGEKPQIVAWHEEARFRDEPDASNEALTCACFLGAVGVASFLLEYGIDPESGNGTGMNAFHWAVNRGQLEVTRLLLQRHVPMTTLNMHGGNVLDTAIWSAINEPRANHLRIIEQLLMAGGRVLNHRWPTGHAEIDALLKRFEAA